MKVKELLTDSNKWCKAYSARDKHGNAELPESPFATRWCLLGAVDKCYPVRDRADARIKLGAAICLIEKSRSSNISVFNDRATTNFSDITKVLELDI